MHSFPHSEEYGYFIAELRAVREEAGMTQAVLAEQLSVDRTLVTKAEGGLRRLDVIELRAWLDAVGTDLRSFVDRLEAKLARHARLTSGKRPNRKGGAAK